MFKKWDSGWGRKTYTANSNRVITFYEWINYTPLTAANNQSAIQNILDKVGGLLLLKGRVNSNRAPKREREKNTIRHTHAINSNSHVNSTLIPWLHQVVMNPNNRVKRWVQREALGKGICPIFWILPPPKKNVGLMCKSEIPSHKG